MTSTRYQASLTFSHVRQLLEANNQGALNAAALSLGLATPATDASAVQTRLRAWLAKQNTNRRAP